MRAAKISGLVLLVLLCSFATWRFFFRAEAFRAIFLGEEKPQIERTISAAPKPKSWFDGTELSSLLPAEELAIGVMIDNATAARPHQAGPDQALITFEIMAEGGVTRLMSIFSTRQHLPLLGPVRSARPYFLDFFRPFHGIFIHAGGSDEAMAELSVQNDVFNLDHAYESAESTTFQRDPEIARPHNLFITAAAVLERLSDFESEEIPQLNTSVFSFGKVVTSGISSHELSIDFPGPDYDSQWVWNAAQKAFVRSQDGSKLLIAVQNLVIMTVPMWPIPEDEKGRMEMDNLGSGELNLFQSGQMRSGTWRKTAKNSPLEFRDENEKELSFLPGKTWIVIIEHSERLVLPHVSSSKTSSSLR